MDMKLRMIMTRDYGIAAGRNLFLKRKYAFILITRFLKL
jgi:hypothetical protein